MHRLLPILAASAAILLSPAAVPVRAADDYQAGPDSKPQEGVAKGEVLKSTFDQSKIFPGTTRDYWIYVPKQYDPAKPACLYVNQDGIQNNAPVVFDNLIARGEIPVTIGVFVMHGRVKAPSANALDRFNRSYEYDGLGDNYARFLLEELLPEVEKKTTSDGRAIHFSNNANDRAIGGSSSGAVCAFTAAWERPDAFSRVFSSIGTYVGLRGANVYPTLIRKYEPKPIRVFLQDGSNDQNIYGGDWWMANQSMERSLAFAGYEVNHVWGDGGHNGKHANAIFPDAIRWLWKDWPKPVEAGKGSAPLQEVLLPGEGWQVAAEGYTGADALAVNAQGEVLFNDTSTGKAYKLGADNKATELPAGARVSEVQTFGPDGKRYVVDKREGKIRAYDSNGQESVLADGIHPNKIAVRNDGLIYVTEDATHEGNVWLIKASGEKRVVDTGMKAADGITFSPDQTLLYIGDAQSHWVYSYQIQADGSLAQKQQYYWLHVPDDADDSGAKGMTVDAGGRLYVASRLGIQICDQAGRVNCIVPTPNGKVSNVVLGSARFDTLYATAGDKVFMRKVKVKAATGFQPPVKPAAPRL